MDVIEAIRRRYSVRAYRNREIEKDKLQELFAAAHLAPSASNRQEWRFIVVQKPETKQQIAEIACKQTFIAQAPVVLVCCAETDIHLMMCGEPCYQIDVAIAIDHITLAATELGLGTCWIGAFDSDKVRKILGIPEEIRLIALLSVGYPADNPGPKKRLPIEQIVKYEHW